MSGRARAQGCSTTRPLIHLRQRPQVERCGRQRHTLRQRDEFAQIVQAADIGAADLQSLQCERRQRHAELAAEQADDHHLPGAPHQVHGQRRTRRRTDEVQRTGNVEGARLGDRLERVGRAGIEGQGSAETQRRFALGRVGVDGDNARLRGGRTKRHHCHADTAAADDRDVVVRAHRRELAQGTEGGDAGTGERGGTFRRERADRHQVARVRHTHKVGVATGELDAQCVRGARAQMLVAAFAHRAGAATEPRVDDHPVAQRHAQRVGAELDHFAADLVAHRHRQRDAAARQRRQRASAHVEATGLHMQVGVAHAAMRDTQRRLRARHWRQIVRLRFERGAPDGEGAAVRAFESHARLQSWRGRRAATVALARRQIDGGEVDARSTKASDDESLFDAALTRVNCQRTCRA